MLLCELPLSSEDTIYDEDYWKNSDFSDCSDFKIIKEDPKDKQKFYQKNKVDLKKTIIQYKSNKEDRKLKMKKLIS